MKNLLVIGSMNIDFVVAVHHTPLVGETILAKDLTFIPGGKGANQAFALGRLGCPVTMLGAVGADDYGEMLIHSLACANVETKHIQRESSSSTGIALIQVDAAGDNCITVIPGANQRVDCAYIQAHMAEINACDMVLLQLEIPYETVLYAAKKAKELGKFVILDPAPASAEIPEELFAFVDIIKPNETELCTLVGDPKASANLSTAADRLLQKGVQTVVVTLGEEGAFIKGTHHAAKHLAARRVRAIDTTAAGDSFTAAMAYRLLMGQSIEDAVSFAMRVSEIVITRKGAQTSIPTMEEVQAYLEGQ